MASIDKRTAQALQTMAANARVQNGHITPRDWQEASARVAENEAKGYRLDGMPKSSIYGVRPRSEEERRKAEKRAALMAAIEECKAAKNAQKPEEEPAQAEEEPEQMPVEAEQNGNLMEALRQMQENQARLEALVAGLMAKKEEEHAAGSNGEADAPGKPEGNAGKADDQAGADGVRQAPAGRDRERGNEDRGSAPETGPVRRDKRGKLTTAQMQEIYARYMAGGVTQGQLAQEYGVSLNTVSVLIRKINAGGRVRGCDETSVKASPNAVWPALEKWRLEQGMSIEEMAEAAGMSKDTLQLLWIGHCRNAKKQMEYGPRMSTIDKLLTLTGLTYEEAFRRGNGK